MTPQELRDLADQLQQISDEATRRAEPANPLEAVCFAARAEGMQAAAMWLRGKAKAL